MKANHIDKTKFCLSNNRVCWVFSRPFLISQFSEKNYTFFRYRKSLEKSILYLYTDRVCPFLVSLSRSFLSKSTKKLIPSHWKRNLQIYISIKIFFKFFFSKVISLLKKSTFEQPSPISLFTRAEAKKEPQKYIHH